MGSALSDGPDLEILLPSRLGKDETESAVGELFAS